NEQVCVYLSLLCNRRHRLPLAHRRLWPHHVPRRSRLLRHVAEGLAVLLPRGTLLCREGRIGELRPVGSGQSSITLGAKRGPCLGLSLLLDLLLCAPCDLRHVKPPPRHPSRGGATPLAPQGRSVVAR